MLTHLERYHTWALEAKLKSGGRAGMRALQVRVRELRQGWFRYSVQLPQAGVDGVVTVERVVELCCLATSQVHFGAGACHRAVVGGGWRRRRAAGGRRLRRRRRRGGGAGGAVAAAAGVAHARLLRARGGAPGQAARGGEEAVTSE